MQTPKDIGMKKLAANSHKKSLGEQTNPIPLLLRIQGLSDPAISEYIAKMRSRFGRYVLPAEEVRNILDKEMGDKTLTGVLFQMREEECQ